MTPAIFPDIESRELGPGRIYEVAKGWQLAAFPIDAALPYAMDGCIVYLWIGPGARPGDWHWTTDPEAIGGVIRAFRTATDRNYTPPDLRAPGGEKPMIRPPIQDLVKRAMEAATPGPEEPPPRDRTLVIPLDEA